VKRCLSNIQPFLFSHYFAFSFVDRSRTNCRVTTRNIARA
jgi:hypothetical protein